MQKFPYKCKIKRTGDYFYPEMIDYEKELVLLTRTPEIWLNFYNVTFESNPGFNGLSIKYKAPIPEERFPIIDRKIKVFEYLMIQCIKWYVDVKCITLTEFNEDNNFTDTKCLLLPAIAFFANTKREEFIRVFDNFVTSIDGIIDEDISHKSKFKYLEMTYYTLRINDFQDIEYFNDIKTECDLIDISIKVLKNKNDKFILLEEDTISFYNQRHNTWQVFAPTVNGRFVDEINKIPNSLLIKEKSVFGPTHELMTYC